MTEVVDGRSFTWEATGPGMKTIARHEAVPDANGSKVTLSIEQTGPMGTIAAHHVASPNAALHRA